MLFDIVDIWERPSRLGGVHQLASEGFVASEGFDGSCWAESSDVSWRREVEQTGSCNSFEGPGGITRNRDDEWVESKHSGIGHRRSGASLLGPCVRAEVEKKGIQTIHAQAWNGEYLWTPVHCLSPSPRPLVQPCERLGPCPRRFEAGKSAFRSRFVPCSGGGSRGGRLSRRPIHRGTSSPRYHLILVHSYGGLMLRNTECCFIKFACHVLVRRVYCLVRSCMFCCLRRGSG